MKSIKLSIEKAREIYSKGDETMNELLLQNFTKEELEKPKAKRWTDIRRKPVYYIDMYANINKDNCFIGDSSDKNSLPSETLAEAMLAMCQIQMLMADKQYNGVPRDEIGFDGKTPHWQIENYDYGFGIGKYETISASVIFTSKEKAELFLSTEKDLLEKAKCFL